MSDSLELELQVAVNYLAWMLGTKLRLFARAMHTLYCRVIFVAPPSDLHVVGVGLANGSSELEFCLNDYFLKSYFPFLIL